MRVDFKVLIPPTPGLTRSADRVLELCPGLARPSISVLRDPSVNAWVFGYGAERSRVILTEGLLGELSEQELRLVLTHLFWRCTVSGGLRRNWGSKVAAVLFRRAPSEWVSLLWIGTPMGHRRLGEFSPLRFLRMIALYPWIRLSVRTVSKKKVDQWVSELPAEQKIHWQRLGKKFLQFQKTHRYYGSPAWAGLALIPPGSATSLIDLAAATCWR